MRGSRLLLTTALSLALALTSTAFAGEKEVTSTILHGLPGERIHCPTGDEPDPLWRESCRKIGRKAGPAKNNVDELFASLSVPSRPDGPWRRMKGKLVRNFEVSRTMFSIEIDRSEKVLIIRYPTTLWCDEPELAAHLSEVGADPERSQTLVPGSKLRPVYPMSARVARIEGRVTLKIVVGSDGTPKKICVDRTSRPYLGFEAASVAAASGLRFAPVENEGDSSDFIHPMVVDFTLN